MSLWCIDWSILEWVILGSFEVWFSRLRAGRLLSFQCTLVACLVRLLPPAFFYEASWSWWRSHLTSAVMQQKQQNRTCVMQPKLTCVDSSHFGSHVCLHLSKAAEWISSGLTGPWLQKTNWSMPSRSLTRTFWLHLNLDEKDVQRIWFTGKGLTGYGSTVFNGVQCARTKVAPSMPLSSRMCFASWAFLWIPCSNSVELSWKSRRCVF